MVEKAKNKKPDSSDKDGRNQWWEREGTKAVTDQALRLTINCKFNDGIFFGQKKKSAGIKRKKNA